jgi:hypothetical protein
MSSHSERGKRNEERRIYIAKAGDVDRLSGAQARVQLR